MKPILELVDDGIQEYFGYKEPMFVACDEFLEYMAECGVLDDTVDMGEFADAWYSFLAEECATL